MTDQTTAASRDARRAGLSLAAALAVILGAVYVNEGGYVNDPADPGGATNYGVTEQVARQAGYAGDMRDFPKHCAEVASAEVCADKIYVERYIARPGFLPLVTLEPAVAEELVDSAVNFGPPRPSRWFQQSLNALGDAKLAVDGKVGPQSVNAFARLQAKRGKLAACVAMLDELDGRQAAEYRRLVRVNPRLKRFFNGWMKHRVGNVDRARCGAAVAG